ncbi:MAG: methyl-accepting chemotaxis protein, partial [Planctomycetes bacterium]|nr:methyl-accepting chemotaxis protein [Planctomycetota bacterium]
MLLKNASFKYRMTLLAATFLLGLVVTHIMYAVMIRTVSVNGPLYDRIVADKDLIADVLPPPQYIIESYLVVLQMVREEDAAERTNLIDRFEQLESEYDAQHTYWVNYWANELDEKDLKEVALKNMLVVDSYKPAKEFYDIVNKQVIAPLKAGATIDELDKSVRGSVNDRYQEHRKAVDEVVKMANTRIEEGQTKAKDSVRRWLIVQVVFGIVVIAVLAAISRMIGRAILVPTAGLIDRMNDMAEGAADLTKRVEVDSEDEIGQLSALINAVIQRIHDLIARVRMATIQLNATAMQIAAAAGEQSSTVQGFNASTSEIAASVKQISATGQELLTTVEDVHGLADQTSASADSGRTGLVSMEET